MKLGRIHRCLVYGLGLVVGLQGGVFGQDPPQSSRSYNPLDDLRLPSFSIFGLSSSETSSLAKPITSRELAKIIAEVEKGRAGKSEAQQVTYNYFIPIVLYRSRSLFSKSSWTKEDIKIGQEVGNFLARLVKNSELRIAGTDQESFRKGLARLRGWFVALCQDDRTLASMIFTLDSGPFFGEEVDANRIADMKVVESVRIPDQQASFVLMTDRSQDEPRDERMIIGVVGDDRSVRWLKRFSAAPKGVIRSATFVRRTIFTVEGYGYVCELMADWTGGMQPSRLYLDESLNLRFYYVRW
jgi:hypothetical protein